VVVEAHHMDLDERVALKFLTPTASREQVQLRRFYREARTAAKIKSPHVTRVLDVGKLETGEIYMVMEYLEGVDLSRYLKTRGKLAITEAVDYILQAADAVAEAHANGIVHRDLKPANIFLAESLDGLRIVKVLDFGIAKQADEEVSGLTDTQLVFGSVVYMSPEQMKSTRDVDARTDVYSLGVTLYEIIAGKPPFQAKLVPELLAAKATGKPTPLRELRPDAPAELEKVLEKAFERDLFARYDSIASFARALAPFASEDSKPLLTRILRINENTTRTLNKAKILPELKQFAKEIESELGDLDPLDGLDEEEDNNSKRISWSDDWSEEVSPKKESSTAVRPKELPLPKPSVPGLAALKQSNPGLLAILTQTSQPSPAPPPVPSTPAILPEPPRAAPPAPPRAPEMLGAFAPEMPAVFAPGPPRAAPPPPLPRAAALEMPLTERSPYEPIVEKPATERPSQDRIRNSTPSGRRRAKRMTLGVLLAVLLLAVGVLAALIILRATSDDNSVAPLPNPTGAPSAQANALTAQPSAALSAPPTAAPAATALPTAAATAMPSAAATAGPMLRHPCAAGTKASTECAKSLVAWCDGEERRIACCDQGMIAMGTGDACGCPEGGPLLLKAISAGCTIPPDRRPLSPTAIQAIMRGKQADYQACYTALPRDPSKLYAHMTLGIELSPDGRVYAAQINHSTMPHPEADACVLRATRALTFPPPPAGVMRFIHSLSVSVGK
jgi:eukaryotic-like serine/threonine-protein kinase